MRVNLFQVSMREDKLFPAVHSSPMRYERRMDGIAECVMLYGHDRIQSGGCKR